MQAITNRRVFAIAGPIILSNLTVPLLGVVDTGVVGHLGSAAPIGAVGLGAVILGFAYWAFGFLRMGASGLVAQARGAGDDAETGALLVRGLMIGAVAGLGLIALQAPFFWAALRISPASPEVEGLTRAYISIRIWGAPAAIAVYAATGWLIAMEKTRGVLILQIWTNGANIALDLVFVVGFGWGVEGVAVATLIAEWTGLAVALRLCAPAFAGAQWRDWSRVFDPARLRRMASISADIMVRSVLLEIGFAYFVFQSAGLGDVLQAANQVLFLFFEVASYTLDGFAFAAETLVGQAMGAQSRGALRQSALLTGKWALWMSGAVSLGLLVGGPVLVRLMTDVEAVRAAAAPFLPWTAALPVLGMPCFMLDGVFIGATFTRDMRNAMLISLPIYIAVSLPLQALWGNHGLWAAITLFMFARGITLWLRYPALERAAGDQRSW